MMQGIDSTQHIASHTKVYTLARARLPRLRFLVLRQYEPSCIRWEVAILQNALRVFDTNRTSMTAVHTLQNLSLSHTHTHTHTHETAELTWEYKTVPPR